MSSVSPSRMNEWEMNDTWLYFTKLDREKSTDKVIYYSDVEDYVYYLNYRYDKTVKQIYADPSAYKDKHLPHTRQGRTFLEGMWEFLNGDKDNLKTVDNLVNDDGEYGLDEKERKEWKQLVEISKDTGRFPFARELDNFLFDKKDSKYKLPMKVLERYGYKDKDNISDIFSIASNLSFLVPINSSIAPEKINDVTTPLVILFSLSLDIRIRKSCKSLNGPFERS